MPKAARALPMPKETDGEPATETQQHQQQQQQQQQRRRERRRQQRQLPHETPDDLPFAPEDDNGEAAYAEASADKAFASSVEGQRTMRKLNRAVREMGTFRLTQHAAHLQNVRNPCVVAYGSASCPVILRDPYDMRRPLVGEPTRPVVYGYNRPRLDSQQEGCVRARRRVANVPIPPKPTTAVGEPARPPVSAARRPEVLPEPPALVAAKAAAVSVVGPTPNVVSDVYNVDDDDEVAVVI